MTSESLTRDRVWTFIPLPCGRFTFVDVDARERFPENWRVMRKRYVAVGRQPKALHRLVLGLEKGDPLEVDHINRDTLDNRRCNLRAVTHIENCQNRSAITYGASRYRGVDFHRVTGMWRARFQQKYIGIFDTEAEAVAAVLEARAAFAEQLEKAKLGAGR